MWTPFQTHYFSENLVNAGNLTRTSGCVARTSDHYITEAVIVTIIAKYSPSSGHVTSTGSQLLSFVITILEAGR
jgi:hypothetical protein